MPIFGFRFGKGDSSAGNSDPSSFAGPRTYYDILGVSPDASEQEIRAAYRQKALEIHPDRNPDDPLASAKFIELNKAYDTLSDQAARLAYDHEQTVFTDGDFHWDVDFTVTMSFGYYGYEIPLEKMEWAEREARRMAEDSDINQAETVARLLLDPYLTETRRLLNRNSKNIALILKLADLYFHTYRPFEALGAYTAAFDIRPKMETARDSEHLGRCYYYAEDYWGGVNRFSEFLTKFPSAPSDVKTDWAEEGIRLLWPAEKEAISDLDPDRTFELKLSFHEKRQEFGYRPQFRDLKSLADAAIKAGHITVAGEYLRAAKTYRREHYETSSLLRSFMRAELLDEAIAVGESVLTPDRLRKTLRPDEKKIARALGDAYEKDERVDDALRMYKKLARYKDASKTVKRKVQILTEKQSSQAQLMMD